PRTAADRHKAAVRRGRRGGRDQDRAARRNLDLRADVLEQLCPRANLGVVPGRVRGADHHGGVEGEQVVVPDDGGRALANVAAVEFREDHWRYSITSGQVQVPPPASGRGEHADHFQDVRREAVVFILRARVLLD